MAPIPWGKFPTVAEHQLARQRLQFMANIGRASNTIDAYGRAVQDHLRFCAAEGTDPLLARADTVAFWIKSMLDRPIRRPSRAPWRAGTGLANATIQQRLVAVRSFYEYLVEDGLREQNPVRRGQLGRGGRRPLRRVEQAPWVAADIDVARDSAAGGATLHAGTVPAPTSPPPTSSRAAAD
ncbi:site-specific integrase [Streptomyces aurantiogriseus]|nr:site-specific integrase [Streptomyces aurantiogriseus]